MSGLIPIERKALDRLMEIDKSPDIFPFHFWSRELIKNKVKINLPFRKEHSIINAIVIFFHSLPGPKNAISIGKRLGLHSRFSQSY